MNFYKISEISPVPNAGLRGEVRGNVINGTQVVPDIIPGSYAIDVWDNGRRWPDLLHSLDCMLWSERVVNAFFDAGLNGVEFYPQKLGEVDSKVLMKLPDPNYHWAHALSGIPAVPGDLEVYPEKKGGYIDKGAFDLSLTQFYPITPNTGFYDLSKKSGVCLWKFDFSHWQGEDLFYISTVHTGYRYCTQRFKDIVESDNLSNFRFTAALNPEGDWFFA